MIYDTKEKILEYAKWFQNNRAGSYICLAHLPSCGVSLQGIDFIKKSADLCNYLIVNISTTLDNVPEIWQAIKDVDDVIIWPWQEDLAELIQGLHPNIMTRSQYSVLTKSEKEALLGCKAEFIQIRGNGDIR